MTPFSARNRLGAPSAPDWGHFPAREAGGIPFRAGNDTFFLPGTASEHLSRRNATCGTNIWWRAWKSLPKKEICAKVFLFLESAIFEKRNGGKFTLLWSSRMLGADPPVRRPASPHTSRAADLPVRTPAGPQLLFMSGAFGEPPFLYAVALFKDFQNAPE